MSDGQSILESALEQYRSEQERNRRELSEVEVLVRQGTTEVDKLSQRELQVSSRVRDMEVNLDRYSKEEIKNFFTAAQEVQMRLQIMRSQLEQLQQRQKNLREQQNHLSDLVELLSSLQGGRSSVAMEDGIGDQHAPEDMIANIIQAHEQERERTSVRIHDVAAQSLSNLVLRAEICQRMIDRDLDMARTELSGLKTAVNTTLQDTRRLIFDLRPMTLEDLGLVPTLRRFTAQFGEQNKIEVNLMLQGLEQRLPSHYEVTIFRFVQEALNNVAKHAAAGQVRVLIDVSDNVLQIVIEDDGSGFPVSETLASASSRKNLGIASMRRQIEMLLRGEFGIESALGRGTRVAATVPFS
jgi:two-component system, NarL family, sensor histidine kinase DegS